MRTQDEMVEWYRARKSEDILGFTAEAVLPFLDFQHAKEFLKPEFVNKEGAEAEWNEDVAELDEVVVLDEMRKYMEFAWTKVEDHRGISASRSVEKMSSWLVALGDDELYAQVTDSANYPQYGAPALKLICDKYGFPVPDSEDIKLMVQGLPCTADYDCGCGR